MKSDEGVEYRVSCVPGADVRRLGLQNREILRGSVTNQEEVRVDVPRFPDRNHLRGEHHPSSSGSRSY